MESLSSRANRAKQTENMLRLYQSGVRVEAIADLYHYAPDTVRQKIGYAKKKVKGGPH